MCGRRRVGVAADSEVSNFPLCAAPQVTPVISSATMSLKLEEIPADQGLDDDYGVEDEEDEQGGPSEAADPDAVPVLVRKLDLARKLMNAATRKATAPPTQLATNECVSGRIAVPSSHTTPLSAKESRWRIAVSGFWTDDAPCRHPGCVARDIRKHPGLAGLLFVKAEALDGLPILDFERCGSIHPISTTAALFLRSLAKVVADSSWLKS